MAQEVYDLACQHEDPCKNQGAHVCTLNTRVDPWRSLASRANGTDELRVEGQTPK